MREPIIIAERSKTKKAIFAEITEDDARPTVTLAANCDNY
jgi:hypothetical protein